jgi:hypothetical protein
LIDQWGELTAGPETVKNANSTSPNCWSIYNEKHRSGFGRRDTLRQRQLHCRCKQLPIGVISGIVVSLIEKDNSPRMSPTVFSVVSWQPN